MSGAPPAFASALLIRHILEAPLAYAAQGEIVHRGRRHGYGELRARVRRLASALTALGIGPGDTVAVMDWDSHRYLECFFAVPMLGAVLLTVNVRLAPEQILYTLNHAGAKLLLVHDDFLPCLERIGGRLETVSGRVRLCDGGAADGVVFADEYFACEYEDMLAAGDADFAFADFDENTRATTFYTTGTTGVPKGVCFSHRQLVLHTLSLLALFGSQPGQGRFDRGDVYMPMTPMFHVHAWGFPYAATMAGATQVYPGRFAAENLLALKAREGVTFSHCVPTVLRMLLDCPSAGQNDLAGWKIVIGGAALPTSLAEAALARGIDLFAGYGMSETCPLLTVAHLGSPLPEGEAALARRVKAGRPVPLVQLRIVDGEMNDVPGGATGEIVARAPWLTPGYLNDPQASARLWAGGWLHTGDIGTIDPDGYLRVTDRIKDVIKSGGEWISSVAVEDILLAHPAVGEAAVIGVPDAKWGERPLALVVPRPGAAADTDAIRAHVQDFADRGAICKLAVPRDILLVAALEHTSVGKLDKKALRVKYAAPPPGAEQIKGA